MRSEYSWLPPDGGTSATKPHQVGISFSDHVNVGYERAGRGTYLDIPAGVMFANGSDEIVWSGVREPSESLEIYPDLDLLRSAFEPGRDAEIRAAAAVHDATMLGMAAVLKRTHVNGHDLDPMQASTLAHRLVTHLADHHCVERPRRTRRSGRLDRTLVDRVRTFVEDRLSEPLVLDDLAAEASLSAFHFARAFKTSTAMAPHEFVTMRRMERAKSLLLATPDSVPTIAYAVGYSNVSHFRRQFRRYTGFAPSDLRMSRRRT
jgi:AraC family transcriptional regulator